MKETNKCYALRQKRGDFDTYLTGNGIDIGAGDDTLSLPHGTVRRWDLEDGDAETLTGIPDDSFDFVYSSHTLEHVRSVERALFHWTRVIRPHGFLYIVVPDYLLYEKLTWPSVFNTDHLHSFSFLISQKMVGRNNHYHIEEDLFPLLRSNGITPLRAEVEATGFDFNKGYYDQTRDTALAQICIVGQKTSNVPSSL